MRAINSTKHTEIASRLEFADQLFTRLKGLLGRNSLAEGEGLLIRPCKGIHTFGMKFPIDALFLDKHNRVIAITKYLVPSRMTRFHFRASCVIEVPAGTLEKTATLPGDQLEFI